MNNWDVHAAVWGASREGNLAFALLSGSTPQLVLQAKIRLIRLKDDELTFYAEVTLQNWNLQSDIDKLAEILVRKPGWQWEEEKKRILVNGNSSFFLPPISYIYGLFLNFCTLLDLELPFHTTYLTCCCGKKSNKFDTGALSSLFT